MKRYQAFYVVLSCSAVFALYASQRSLLAQTEKGEAVAGKADVLRHVPKQFATLVGVDVASSQVRLQLECEEPSRLWPVMPDAELKIHGWWGRLEQFQPGDCVWVWFAIDRNRQPTGVLMLADEISQQTINGLPHTLKSLDAENNTVVLESADGARRELNITRDGGLASHIGEPVWVQSAGQSARILATQQQLESMRREQKERLREEWRKTGLPATVVYLHLAGEMETMLDHEAMRWGRYLKSGDEVTIRTEDPITAAVKEVEPWRERTRLRLVASGVDQADLAIGQRIRLGVPEPPEAVQQSELPTDIARREAKGERVEWFLASIYCPCKIGGNKCTGMFYSLASCNVNGCAMPNSMRGKIGEMIDQRMSDEQIWQQLQKLFGPQVANQHLLK